MKIIGLLWRDPLRLGLAIPLEAQVQRGDFLALLINRKVEPKKIGW